LSEFISYRELVDSHGKEAADWVLEFHPGYGPSDDLYFPRDVVEDALGVFESETADEEFGDP
jgi:hypothetical protein